MKFLETLHDALAALPADIASPALHARLDAVLPTLRNRDAEDWQAALDTLPALPATGMDLTADCIRIGDASAIDAASRARLHEALQHLHPWRKGPFTVFGVHVDSEWRSDLKWRRVQDAIQPLAGRRVLDVGCGNGYYALRMLGAGARCVLGIDPGLRLLAQFDVLRRYLPALPLVLLPLRSEDLPPAMQAFDTVFSMGVIYHRRDPLEHLAELRGALAAGGELVLETLVVPGDAPLLLGPADRYAKMRNVWCVPSVATVLEWLARAGFGAARCVDECATSTEEQRATAWMRFESLADFLDPVFPWLTVEGHPAPRRAIFTARRPAADAPLDEELPA